MKAIVDAFDPVEDVQVSIQASSYTTIQTVLLIIQSAYNELERISSGDSVQHDDCGGYIPAPTFSKHFSRSIKEWLDAKVRVHDVWLIRCVLYPFLREIQMVPSGNRHRKYKKRVEKLIKKILREAQEAPGNVLCDEILSTKDPSFCSVIHASEAGGVCKKRKFNLLSYADRISPLILITTSFTNITL